MDGLVVLEVSIGLVLVYLVLSIIATSAMELLAQWRGLRGKNLRRAIEALLGEGGDSASLTDAFYDQPAIRALMKDDREPSYIPPRTFAEVVLDLTAARDWRQSDAAPRELSEEFEGLKDEPEEPGHRVAVTLTGFLDQSGGDIEKLLKRIESWFGDTTQRSTGWYRRLLNKRMLAIGLGMALLANVDTLQIVRNLTADKELRAAAVRLAEERIARADSEESQGDGGEGSSSVETIKQELGEVQPFVGWTSGDPVLREWPWVSDASSEKTWGRWVLALLAKLVGLFFTAFAISLGSSFWFDLMRRLVNVRSSLKQEEEAAPTRKTGATSS